MKAAIRWAAASAALAVLFPAPVLAHPGHGTWDWRGLLHWLFDHGWVGLLAVALGLAVATFLARGRDREGLRHRRH